MKFFSLLVLLTATIVRAGTNVTICDVSEIRFQALAHVESGDRDDLTGSDGEVSRYQITPAVWRQYAVQWFNGSTVQLSPANPATALNVAKVVMAARVAAFSRGSHRPPSDIEWYLLWHRPARVKRPRTEELARAARFAATLENIQRSTLNHQP